MRRSLHAQRRTNTVEKGHCGREVCLEGKACCRSLSISGPDRKECSRDYKKLPLHYWLKTMLGARSDVGHARCRPAFFM